MHNTFIYNQEIDDHCCSKSNHIKEGHDLHCSIGLTEESKDITSLETASCCIETEVFLKIDLLSFEKSIKSFINELPAFELRTNYSFINELAGKTKTRYPDIQFTPPQDKAIKKTFLRI